MNGRQINMVLKRLYEMQVRAEEIMKMLSEEKGYPFDATRAGLEDTLICLRYYIERFEDESNK